ncbi:MAG: Hsp20/alpha crystallin family protein [Burkholderiales bacterium]|nr:MAG: Hsp20/alpha crystallin family protein [Burkholderiales bacterium]
MFFSPVRVSRSALNGYGYAPHIWSRFDSFEATEQHKKIESDDASITLSLDVPGLSKEQLTIGIEGRIVRIASKDDAPRSFKATYKLGSDVDAAQSEAKLENGVLTLKFTKIAPESRQTLLTIN